MKSKLSGLALAGTLILGCGEFDNKNDHQVVKVGDILDEMFMVCNSTASDVEAVVCPVANEDGLNGFMKLNCWVSSSAGEVSCIETGDEKVCRSYSNGDRCKREFEVSGTTCGFGQDALIFEPDLSTDVIYGRGVPENDLGCSVIGSY